MLIRHLWQVKTVVFLHWWLIHAILLNSAFPLKLLFTAYVSYPMLTMTHPSRNYFVLSLFCIHARVQGLRVQSGNTKGGSITVPLTSCLTGLDKSVLQIKT